MQEATYKRCRKCGREKLATRDHFYANRKLKGGLHSECRPCAVERSCEYARRKAPQRREERLKRLRQDAHNLAATVAPEVGFWVAGLIDGEGSFSIRKARRGGHPCQFRLSLRADDGEVLAWVVRETRLGYTGAHSRRMASWTVSSKVEVLALALLLDRFPLRTQKRHDLKLWAEAVRLWIALPAEGRAGGGSFARDWSAIAELRAALLEGRAERSASATDPCPS